MKVDMTKYAPRYNGIIPDDLRGVIKGQTPKRPVVARKGGTSNMLKNMVLLVVKQVNNAGGILIPALRV